MITWYDDRILKSLTLTASESVHFDQLRELSYSTKKYGPKVASSNMKYEKAGDGGKIKLLYEGNDLFVLSQ
jgi:hypothetical protein